MRGFGLLSFACLALAGCTWGTPTLRVERILRVDPPDSYIDIGVWSKVDRMTLTARRGGSTGRETLPVQVRAVHDTRSIALLVSWPDDTDSFDKRLWIWNNASNQYRLITRPVDRAEVFWQMTAGEGENLLEGEAALHDVWRWEGGWSDYARYAEDLRIMIQPMADGTPRDDVRGRIFPALRGDRWLEWREIPDSGITALKEAAAPAYRKRYEEPGYTFREPTGSAADVRVVGLYQKFRPEVDNHYFIVKGMRGFEMSEEPLDGDEQGYWAVEFNRLLVTQDENDDYQIRDLTKPHRMRVLIHDRGDSGPNAFSTGPIDLVFE